MGLVRIINISSLLFLVMINSISSEICLEKGQCRLEGDYSKCNLNSLCTTNSTIIYPGGDTRCIKSTSTEYAFEVCLLLSFTCEIWETYRFFVIGLSRTHRPSLSLLSRRRKLLERRNNIIKRSPGIKSVLLHGCKAMASIWRFRQEWSAEFICCIHDH